MFLFLPQGGSVIIPTGAEGGFTVRINVLSMPSFVQVQNECTAQTPPLKTVLLYTLVAHSSEHVSGGVMEEVEFNV